MKVEDRLERYVEAFDADVAPVGADEVLARAARGRGRDRRMALVMAVGAVALIVGVAAALVWRGSDDPDDLAGDGGAVATDELPAHALPVDPDVSLWLSAERVPPGDAELLAVLVNHTGVDATFGVGSTVDRWDGEAWVPHRQLAFCLDHWFCTGRMASLDESIGIEDIGVSAQPGLPGPPMRFSVAGLDEGWYRIVSTAYGGIEAVGVFQVASGAEPPVPLVDVDGPAISVVPTLVSADGGQVELRPLIPSGPSGSQTIEDVQRAVTGLSEAATIERWHEGAWLFAAEVELRPAPGDESGIARVTDLAPLIGGPYRVVRTGPNGTHTGNFWAVDLGPSTDPAAGPPLDPGASAVCPAEISSLRLSGGRLVAGYDTTVESLRASGLVSEGPLVARDGADAAIVCWYADVTFAPAFEDDVTVVPFGLSVYVDGNVGDDVAAAMTVDLPPFRP